MLTVDVIEDDLAMRALLLEWLSSEGYRVRAYASIGTALKTDVDAVVVNLLNLPVQGAETIRHLKSLYADVPLIGLSTQAHEASTRDNRLAHALGLARLVPKPCTRSELMAAVAEAIGRSS